MRKRLMLVVFLATVLVGLWVSSPVYTATRVYVRVGPPAARVDVRGVRPSPRHVWVGGFHRWDGANYVWAPGRWDLAPRGHGAWVPGHWNHDRRHGWYWVEGHWR